VFSPEPLSLSLDARVFGASVIGPLHLQLGLPCQDACAYGISPSGSLTIAVADGLGSATMSQAGAQVAVASALNAAMNTLDAYLEKGDRLDEVVRNAAVSARAGLECYSANESCTLRELACTLILAVVRKDRLAIAHIGDGAVVVEAVDGLSIISAPEESEFTNEVVPITSSNWDEHLRIVSSTLSIKSIAVFTDGCQRAAFRRAGEALQPFDRFFNPIFDYARSLTDPEGGTKEIVELLGSAKVCENSDDDKTLVVGVINVG
jgi:hypothetical protein